MIRALALAAALLVCGRTAVGQPLTAREYGRVIGHAAQALERAAKAGEEAKRQAQAAVSEVPERAVVRPQSGGAPVEVDNRKLLKALRAKIAGGKRGIGAAAQVLRNLRQNLETTAKAPPADAREALARVLRRREFRPSRLAALQEALYRKLARIISYIFEHLPGLSLPADVRRPLLIAAFAVVAAAALFLVMRLVLRLAPRGGKAEVEAATRPPEIKPHAAWLEEAESALRAGDHRAALRALHMAALMRLDESGHIRYVDSRTDGGFLRALRESGRHDLADALAALSVIFAIVWYGMAPAGPTEYRAAREHWDKLEALAAA